MSKARRSFSASEKLSIINEADQFGVTQTLPKHHLSPSVFRRWKESFNEGSISNLKSYAKQSNPELVAAMEEIRLLKNILAKQSIELEFKTELLKKVNSTSSVGRGDRCIKIKPHGHKAGPVVLVRRSPQKFLLQTRRWSA
ncbi:MAG: transposase [Chitinophagia bacterium]|jgi:putative transposase